MQRRAAHVTRRRVAAHACPGCRRLWALRGLRTDAGAWLIQCSFCGWQDVRGGGTTAGPLPRTSVGGTPAAAPPASDAPATDAPATDAPWASRQPGWPHGVLLYRDDTELLDVLEDYLATGWGHGGGALVIATPEHRAALRRRLAARGWTGSIGEGRLVELDAAATLEQFMRDGAPDPGLFDLTVGSLVHDHAAGTTLRGFGEMVDVLWARGDVVGALALERLWSGLQERVGFELLCAYAAAHVDPQDRGTLTCLHDRAAG